MLYRIPEKHKWSTLHSNYMRHTPHGKLHLEGLQDNQRVAKHEGTYM